MSSSNSSGGLATSDIIGIAIGVPSGVLALVGVAISFCAWQFPDSRIGKAGVAIGNRFSVRGGDAFGGDASGAGARGGNARGGSASGRGAQPEDSQDDDAGTHGTYDIEANAESEAKGGDARGGNAYGNSAAGGNARGGDARAMRARGGDALGGSAIYK